MKKSKVIIPAMALLLFSTAASITGTVAWFTATRVFTTSADTFAVNSIDGNLEAAVTARVGTQKKNGVEAVENYQEDPVVDPSDSTKYTKHIARLTHGSFNHESTNAFILNSESSDPDEKFINLGTEATAKADEATHRASDWFRKSVAGTKQTDKPSTGQELTPIYDYFVAFSWHIDFTYSLGGGETNAGIFLDYKLSHAEKVSTTDDSSSAEIKTANGFRIAFYPVDAWNSDGTSKTEALFASGDNTSDKAGRVFSKDDPTIADNKVNDAFYVKPATPNADYAKAAEEKTGVYNSNATAGTGNYIWNNTKLWNNSSTNYERRGETETYANAKNYPDFICPISNKMRVICVAWFDGTSDHVVNAAEKDVVTANLTFYARALS